MKPKDYVPFLLSGAAGLMLRTVMAGIDGIAYTMNGRDLFNALAGLIICYWLRVLIRSTREERPEQSRRKAQRNTVPADRENKAA